MNTQKSSKTPRILLALAVTLPCAVYLLWTFANIPPHVGSVTDYGTVYAYQLDGYTLYQSVIRNDSGVIDTGIIGYEVPYIYQDGDTVILAETSGFEQDYTVYDLKTGTILDFVNHAPAPRLRNPFSKIEHVKTVKVDTGTPYVQVYDLSAKGEPLWYWKTADSNWDELWCDRSETAPEIKADGDLLTVFFTEEGLPKCREFNVATGHSSYDYVLYEDGRIYVEQAIDDIETEDYDETGKQVQTTGFVNTVPKEIADLIDAYLRAKDEVTIPYDLVRIHANYSLDGFTAWEIIFSDKSDPDTALARVFMDNDGIPYLILRSE